MIERGNKREVIEKTTPVRFELTRAMHNRLAGDPVNHSGKVPMQICICLPSQNCRSYQGVLFQQLAYSTRLPPSRILPSVMAASGESLLIPRNGKKFTLVIHGGAGTMSRKTATPERQALYRVALKKALQAGYAVLNEGGEAMDAAVATVTVLEGGCSCQESGIAGQFYYALV